MIHLASKSPRRRILLQQIGIDYAIVDAPIDETRRAEECPQPFVERMAREKALAGLAALRNACIAPVLAADTAVVLDGQVLGKPRDEEHAMEMLRALSGRMHHVISTVAVAAGGGGGGGGGGDGGDGGGGGGDGGGGGGEQDAADRDGHSPDIGTAAGDMPKFMTSVSRVWFREISYEERRACCATGEPLDKAGAYAIQGRAATFITRLDGSYSGVMGLPLFETASLLREAGIKV